MQTICLLSKLKGVGFELERAQLSWAELSWAEAGVQGRGNQSWAGEGWVQGLFELSWHRRQKVQGRLGEQGRGRLNRMKSRMGSEESKKSTGIESHILQTQTDLEGGCRRAVCLKWQDQMQLDWLRPSSPVSTQVIRSTNTVQRENPWQKWRAWQ